jgi:hypothetical protein
MTARTAACVLVVLAAVQLTGCGGTKATVTPDGAAQAVADALSSQKGFRPTDVKCPSGEEANVGVEFDCHFTGPEGKLYTAHMRITKVDGSAVYYDIQSRLS